MKYGKVTPGKRRVIPKKGLRLICCDCGAAFRTPFVSGRQLGQVNRLYMTVWRDEKLTRSERKLSRYSAIKKARRKTDRSGANSLKVFSYRKRRWHGERKSAPCLQMSSPRPCGR